MFHVVVVSKYRFKNPVTFSLHYLKVQKKILTQARQNEILLRWIDLSPVTPRQLHIACLFLFVVTTASVDVIAGRPGHYTTAVYILIIRPPACHSAIWPTSQPTTYNWHQSNSHYTMSSYTTTTNTRCRICSAHHAAIHFIQNRIPISSTC